MEIRLAGGGKHPSLFRTFWPKLRADFGKFNSVRQ